MILYVRYGTYGISLNCRGLHEKNHRIFGIMIEFSKKGDILYNRHLLTRADNSSEFFLLLEVSFLFVNLNAI